MTARQLFQMNSDKMDRLAALLDDSVLKEALFIVRQESFPKEPAFRPDVDMRDALSLEAGKSIGANEFFNKLQNLAKRPNVKDGKLEQEYIKQARERLFATGLYTVDEINEAERLSQLNQQPE